MDKPQTLMACAQSGRHGDSPEFFHSHFSKRVWSRPPFSMANVVPLEFASPAVQEGARVFLLGIWCFWGCDHLARGAREGRCLGTWNFGQTSNPHGVCPIWSPRRFPRIRPFTFFKARVEIARRFQWPTWFLLSLQALGFKRARALSSWAFVVFGMRRQPPPAPSACARPPRA